MRDRVGQFFGQRVFGRVLEHERMTSGWARQGGRPNETTPIIIRQARMARYISRSHPRLDCTTITTPNRVTNMPASWVPLSASSNIHQPSTVAKAGVT